MPFPRWFRSTWNKVLHGPQRPLLARLTTGISRTVYLVGPYAIKLPCARYSWRHWLQGLLANLQERTWGRDGRPGFCPVLLSDPLGLVVVMPRCRILERALPGLTYIAYREVLGVFAEPKADSWGWMPSGELVAVDYGN